jgi:hypothetical protein
VYFSFGANSVYRTADAAERNENAEIICAGCLNFLNIHQGVDKETDGKIVTDIHL